MLREDSVHELLQLVVGGIDVDTGSLESLAVLRKLVKTFLTATSDDDRWLAVEVVYRERECSTDAGSRTDDENTLRVLDACHDTV